MRVRPNKSITNERHGKMKSGVSVVIPCLNEEDSVADVVKAAKAGFAKLKVPGEVIVVDNASSDRSAERAAAAGARVVLEKRRGYGAAIRRGFASAEYSVLVMADADMSYDLTKLDEMVKPILDNEIDFMIGNRLDGVQEGAMPKLHQHLGTPLLTFLLRILYGCKNIKDSQCGMRAVRRTAYEGLGCVTTGMEFASEMIVKAIQGGLRIRQHDIEYHCRAGVSKLRPLQDGWRHIRFILLYVPSHVILTLPLLIWLLSFTAVAMLLWGPVKIGPKQFDMHSMVLATFINIVSIQVISGGMLSRIYAHLSGFRSDALIVWFYRRFRFKSGSNLSLLLLVAGVLWMLWGASAWLRLERAGDDALRQLLFGVCCAINGLQIWGTSYMTSIMALPHDSNPAGE